MGALEVLAPKDAATAIAVVGLFATLVGAAVSLFNSWKAVCWKRAELANAYIKDFNGNDEMVFAGRCLDWEGGRLVIPEKLRPYLPDNAQYIEHDKRVMAKALSPTLTLEQDDDPRIQIYRTSMDSFLSWLSLVASGLNRKLFSVADIEEVGYWVSKIQSEPMVHGFIVAYGYRERMMTLVRAFRRHRNPYRYWHFIPSWLTNALAQVLRSPHEIQQDSDPQPRPPHGHARQAHGREATPEGGDKRPVRAEEPRS